MLCQFLPYSKVNQLYICIFFFIFFPHIGYYRYCVAFPVLYSRFSLVTYFIYAVLCLIAQLYLTLCNSMDYSPPGSSVHGILQARILGWGLPWPPPVDLPNPGIKPRSSAWQADSLPSESPGRPRILDGVASPFSRGTSLPGVKWGSLALQVDSLPAKPPGKPILYILVCIQYMHRSKEKQEDVKQNAAFLVAAL